MSNLKICVEQYACINGVPGRFIGGYRAYSVDDLLNVDIQTEIVKLILKFAKAPGGFVSVDDDDAAFKFLCIFPAAGGMAEFVTSTALNSTDRKTEKLTTGTVKAYLAEAVKQWRRFNMQEAA